MGGRTKLHKFQQCSHRNSGRGEKIFRSDVDFSLISQVNCCGPWPQTPAWLIQTFPSFYWGTKILLFTSFLKEHIKGFLSMLCLEWPTRVFLLEIWSGTSLPLPTRTTGIQPTPVFLHSAADFHPCVVQKQSCCLLLLMLLNPPPFEEDHFKGTRFLLRDGEDDKYGLPKDSFLCHSSFLQTKQPFRWPALLQ